MEITVNFDSLEGREKTYNTCELDWSAYSAMPDFHVICQVTKEFPNIPDNVTAIQFYSGNGDYGSCFTWLPNTETDENTLNNYANIFEDGRPYVSVFRNNPANYEEQPTGTMPTDWGDNPHYMRSVYTASPIDDRSVIAFVPVSTNEVWDMNETYYLDLTGKMVNIICLKNGYKFATSKGRVSGSVTSFKSCIVGGAGTFEPFINSTGYQEWRTDYVFTNTAAVSPESPIDISNPANYPTYEYTTRSPWSGVELRPIAESTILFNVFISTTISGQDFIGLASIVYNTQTQKYTDIGGFLFSRNFWEANLQPAPPEEGEWGDNTEPDAPHGNFEINSDNVGTSASDASDIIDTRISTVANNVALLFSSGIYKLYIINLEKDFIHWDYKAFEVLFTELYSDEYMQRYTVSFFNPLSAVLSFHLLPSEFVEFRTSGNPPLPLLWDLVICRYNFSEKYKEHHSEAENYTFRVAKNIVHYNVGSFDFSEAFKYDQFLDFAPYTKCYIHLPFIGKVELGINQIMYGELGVDYACDVVSGNVIATIWCKDYRGNSQFIHTASGNCAYNIPLFSMSQDGSSTGKLIASVTSLAITGISAATGNVVGMIGGLGSSVANAVDAYNAHITSSTVISGEIGGNNSLTSPLDCFIELIHPQWSESMHYKKLKGIPSQMSNTIANSSQTTGGVGYPYDGYLEVSHIELDSITATDSEKAEIAEILAKGVHIRGEELL